MKLKDVKKGERFFERDGSMFVQLVALEGAREISQPNSSGHEVRCRIIHGTYKTPGEELTLFEAHNAGHYGLKLSPLNGTIEQEGTQNEK